MTTITSAAVAFLILNGTPGISTSKLSGVTYCANGNSICGNPLKSHPATSANTSKNLPVLRIFLIHLECCEVEPVNIERLLHKQKPACFAYFFPYFLCPQ